MQPIVLTQQPSFFTNIPTALITPEGIFKYILILAIVGNEKHYFVRGFSQFTYHKQIFKEFGRQLQKLGYKVTGKMFQLPKKYEKQFTAEKNGKKVKFQCLGGGRIQHNYKGNKCFIYGYSKTFGRVDHEIAKQLIHKKYGYKNQQIVTSKDGY